jgi:hypothetical protein
MRHAEATRSPSLGYSPPSALAASNSHDTLLDSATNGVNISHLDVSESHQGSRQHFNSQFAQSNQSHYADSAHSTVQSPGQTASHYLRDNSHGGQPVPVGASIPPPIQLPQLSFPQRPAEDNYAPDSESYQKMIQVIWSKFVQAY